MFSLRPSREAWQRRIEAWLANQDGFGFQKYFFTYIGVDLLEEFHFFNHSFDFALEVDTDEGSVIAILTHLGEVSLQVFTLLLKK